MNRTAPSPGAAAWVAMGGAFAMIANQVAGKSVRDALFLSTFGVEYLPRILIAGALVSILTVILSSRVLSRREPGAVVPIAYALSALMFVIIWPLVTLAPRVAAVVLYLHLSVGGAVLISWFWSAINERFDPRSARKSMARIAGGGTFGGLMGGLLAERVAAMESVSITVMLPILAGFHILCSAMMGYVHWRRDRVPRFRSGTDEQTGWRGGVRILGEVSHLRNLAVLVMVLTIVAAFLDFLLKSAATVRFPDGEELLRFFAIFYTLTGFLTFVVQGLITGKLLERIGLARSAALLPAAAGVGGVALLVPGLLGLVSSAVVRGAESILRSSAFRSSYELFFTPVLPREKRVTKTLIDVGFERLGDAVGGGAIQVVLWGTALLAPAAVSGVSTLALRILIVLVILLALVALSITRRLDRGYVSALERSLIDQGMAMEEATITDSTTRTVFRRVLETFSGSRSSLPALPVSPGTHARIPEHPPAGPTQDPVVARIADLRSGNAERVASILQETETPLPAPLVAHVIELLGWDQVSRDAIHRLRVGCDLHAGQLVDALLDPDTEFVIRRRIPRILSHGSTVRVVDGLLAGTADPRFEVRYRCGVALARIHDRFSDLEINREAVLRSVQRDATVDRRVWESHRLLDQEEEGETTPFVREVLRERSGRGLQHLMTMLSLVYPTQPLLVAYRGLLTSDRTLRGTALEYLDSLLPSSLKETLWPLLGESRLPAPTGTSPEDLLGSLLRAHESIQVNLDELRRARKEPDPGSDAED